MEQLGFEFELVPIIPGEDLLFRKPCQFINEAGFKTCIPETGSVVQTLAKSMGYCAPNMPEIEGRFFLEKTVPCIDRNQYPQTPYQHKQLDGTPTPKFFLVLALLDGDILRVCSPPTQPTK